MKRWTSNDRLSMLVALTLGTFMWWFLAIAGAVYHSRTTTIVGLIGTVVYQIICWHIRRIEKKEREWYL